MTSRQRVRRILLLAVVGGALALGFVGLARADHQPGTAVAQHAACWNNQITVGTPQINAAPASVPAGVAVIGGNGQVVSVRSSLARWYPGVGWQTVQYGTWKKSTAGNWPLGESSWTTLDGRPVSATQTFPITQSGTYSAKLYYAVYTEYRWHADPTHHGGYAWGWNPHHENRLGYRNQESYAWCEYPGPNGVTIG